MQNRSAAALLPAPHAVTKYGITLTFTVCRRRREKKGGGGSLGETLLTTSEPTQGLELRYSASPNAN